MFKSLKSRYYTLGAAFTAGMVLGAQDAQAQTADVSKVAANIMTSFQDLPAFIQGGGYMLAVGVTLLGLKEIKDHVSNPGNTPLAPGVAKLGLAGAIFATSIVTEAMFQTIDDNGAGVFQDGAVANKTKLFVQ